MDAEFKAWARQDPEGEKRLYQFDKDNAARLLGYWEQLECFQERVTEEGDLAFGQEPGSPGDEQ